jgi:hypothetical protein
MAAPDEFKFTFLRGSGFLHSLVGEWDLMADESGQWPAQKGFLIFDETKLIIVIERHEAMRRGIEGTYSVEDDRIVMTKRLVDTAPEQGALGDMEFVLDGDILMIKWGTTKQIDQFQRRLRPDDKPMLPPTVAIYEGGGARHDSA